MMTLLEMHYKGAMADDPRLEHAREVLAKIKTEKIAKKAKDWKQSDSSMVSLLKHLAEEVIELSLVVSADNISKTFDEAGDVSNMVDIITVLAVEREKGMWMGRM